MTPRPDPLDPWGDIVYFRPSEFDSPDAPGSGREYMSLAFVRKLDRMRMMVGAPLKVNSGYRTLERNRLAGGKPKSAHRHGEAADIQCATSKKRFLILEAAIKLKFRRIGIAKTFIHLDDSQTLPDGVVWLY